jgi:putative oxidoreductase
MHDSDSLFPYAHAIAARRGETLQRLFTMFPRGWPGAGLLLIRLAAAIPLLIDATSKLFGTPQNSLHAEYIEIGVGSLLVAGLWTPVAGALQAVIEVWLGFSGEGGTGVHFLLAALGVSLVMLGPGGRSVDALLFGRKRIDIRGR